MFARLVHSQFLSFVSVSAALAIALPAYASKEGGNGGEAYVCRDQRDSRIVKSVQLMDLAEAGNKVIDEGSLTAEQHLDSAYRKLVAAGLEEFAAEMKDRVSNILRKWVSPDAPLTFFDDARDHLAERDNCAHEQLAYYNQKTGELQLNRELKPFLTQLKLAALAIHEASYAWAGGGEALHDNSYDVRVLVRALFMRTADETDLQTAYANLNADRQGKPQDPANPVSEQTAYVCRGPGGAVRSAKLLEIAEAGDAITAETSGLDFDSELNAVLSRLSAAGADAKHIASLHREQAVFARKMLVPGVSALTFRQDHERDDRLQDAGPCTHELLSVLNRRSHELMINPELAPKIRSTQLAVFYLHAALQSLSDADPDEARIRVLLRNLVIPGRTPQDVAEQWSALKLHLSTLPLDPADRAREEREHAEQSAREAVEAEARDRADRKALSLGATRPISCWGTECTMDELAGIYTRVGGDRDCDPAFDYALGACGNGDGNCTSLSMTGYIDPKSYEGKNWFHERTPIKEFHSDRLRRDRDSHSLAFATGQYEWTYLRTTYDGRLQISTVTTPSGRSGGGTQNCLYERHYEGSAQ